MASNTDPAPGAAGLEVRLAEPAELESVGRVRARSWQAGYAGLMRADYLAGLDDDAVVREWAANLASSDPVRVWVAVRAGRVLGFACVGPERDDGATTSRGEVYALYVDPDVWRHGVGRALMEAVLGDLREAGFDQVGLWVLETNASGIAFYRRLGFVPTGDRSTCHVDDLPEVRYARAIA